ncbi:MAG: IS110 family transposase [Ferruginibacter sp.]
MGSRSHYVAIGQGKDDVKQFGVYNEDLAALVQHLLDNDITHVCMESTGTYWQSLFSVIQEAGITVKLCNGRYTKNPNGKKTDVQDCQHIQKLFSLDLLKGSFLPDSMTEQLRTYSRHRLNLIQQEADSVRKMQKYLRLLNVRLDVVLKDITGLTGITIIEAICKGETNPQVLASFRNGNCKKSVEEIAKALQSNKRPDYLFCLQQELSLYKTYRSQIELCDAAIKKMLEEHIDADEEKKKLSIADKPHKKVNKNAPKNMDVNQLAFRYFGGVDLMAIEGVSHATVMAIMSEVGLEGFKKFETAKQFANWLRLTPNTKITGGKVISSHIPKGGSRLKIALRNAANAIGNLKDSHLSDFFRRILYKNDRASAISATARKLGVIIWNMVTKKQAYNPPTEYLLLDQKRKLKLVKQVRKTIAKLELKPQDLGFANS